ncbi:hypothetical protein [Devosia elaeis]|uniref:hypothetical protein n=1 Tax=Devosia elaeis TaxID=1770058 RepID=UPI000AE42615|nr:hypothetical protein [Devosia elaeis]
MHDEYPDWSLTMAIAWITTGDLIEVSRWAERSPVMSHAVQILDDDDTSLGWKRLLSALANGQVVSVASKNGEPMEPMTRLDWSLGSGSYEADFSLTWHNRTGDSFREIYVVARDVQRLFPGDPKRPALRLVTAAPEANGNEHIGFDSEDNASSRSSDYTGYASSESTPTDRTASSHTTAKRRGRGRRRGSGAIDDANALDAIKSRADGHEDRWWRECGAEAQKLEPRATPERISSIQKRLYGKLTRAKAAISTDELS